MGYATLHDSATTPTLCNPPVRAAHLFNCFEPWKAREICQAEGFSEAHIRRGSELAEIKREVRGLLCGIYGNPMYGSWPDRAFDTQREEYARRGAVELLEAK